jgi:hypothetical protein
MSIFTFILGLGIGFGAGTGIWRTILARIGAAATAAAASHRFSKFVPAPVNCREKKD